MLEHYENNFSQTKNDMFRAPVQLALYIFGYVWVKMCQSIGSTEGYITTSNFSQHVIARGDHTSYIPT